MNLLVTGGAGFIGSNFVRFLRRERPDWRVVNLDKLTYAGNAESLPDARDFVHGDITDVNNAYIARGDLTFDELKGWWTDAGTFDSLRRANDLLLGPPEGGDDKA